MGLDGVRRIDWHDYEAMRKDAARTGGSKLLLLMLLFHCSMFAEDPTIVLNSETHLLIDK